jgi:Ca2+:H+ antiporter
VRSVTGISGRSVTRVSGFTRLERSLFALIAVLTTLAGVANYQVWPAIPRFAVATLALAGLAWVVSFATEQLGERYSAGVTGLLQSTLGNLPELFVVIFALNAHQLVVAQTALVGSLLANALLVLGLVIVVGAAESKDGLMRFHPRLPNDTATLQLVTVFIIVIVGLSLSSGDRASHHVKTISAIGAVCLLAVYIAWVVPYVHSDAAPAPSDRTPRVALTATVLLLVAGGVASAFVSDWFVNGLQPAIRQLGISQAFAGLVIVAIAGNAVENVAGLVLAAKGQADLAISVVKNSVAQIAAFLFPALVLISFALATTLTFALPGVLIGAGVGAGFVSNWFVDALAPAIHRLHISQAFAGLVIVAIAGNAVENVTGLVLARKGQADLAISVVKNSVAQIAAFLFPVLVLISFALATTLTFALPGVLIGALALMAISVWQVTGDGEAAAFEGWALVTIYVVVAVVALYE